MSLRKPTSISDDKAFVPPKICSTKSSFFLLRKPKAVCWSLMIFFHIFSVKHETIYSNCNLPCSHGVVVIVLGSVLYDEMRALTHDVCSSSSRVINTNCHAINEAEQGICFSSPPFKLQRKFAFEILCCCCLLWLAAVLSLCTYLK